MVSRLPTDNTPTACAFCGHQFDVRENQVYAWQSTSGHLYCSKFCADDDERLSGALQKEVARVRDVLMPMYRPFGSAGNFVLAIMGADLDCAMRALIQGDAVSMLGVYELLKAYKE